MKNLSKISTQNRSRCILPESLCAKGSLFEFRRYLYLLRCMSADVTVILSRMQNICLKPVQLVGEVVTCVICFIVALDCVLFYLSVILRFVVIYV